MGAFRMRLTRQVVVVLIALLGMALVFQNCSRVNFSLLQTLGSPDKITASNNGTFFDGKLTYYHSIPGYTCEDKASARSEILSKEGKYFLTQHLPEKCAGVDKLPLPSAEVDRSAYNQELIGFNSLIFVRADNPPQTDSSLLTEAWCQPEIADPSNGIDIAITVNETNLVTQGRVYRSNQAPLNLPLQRTVSNTLADYQGQGVSLKIDRSVPGAKGWDFSGALDASLNGKTWSQKMSCRFASPKFKDNLLGSLNFCTGQALSNLPYAGGTGSLANPYKICTPQQMNQIGLNPADLDKSFKLMSDIDMSIYTGTQYNILGKTPALSFTGRFDGNYFIISNLTYTTTSATNYVGLFGHTRGFHENTMLFNPTIASAGDYVGALIGSHGNATASKHNSVVGGSVSGNQFVGGLIGSGSNISSSFSSAQVSVKSASGGGLVGYAGGTGEIYNSHARGDVFQTGTVLGNGIAGGLAGSGDSSIVSSSATGQVKANGHFVGGLVGSFSGSVLESSYATGDVQGNSHAGGLVGYLRPMPFSTPIIGNCYSRGQVSAITNTAGGLVGFSVVPVGVTLTMIHNLATGEVSASSIAAGLVGAEPLQVPSNGIVVHISEFWNFSLNSTLSGIYTNPTASEVFGKSNEELHDPNTYLQAGWDPLIWNLSIPGAYPKLQWEP